jgi:hypothetical protein
VNRIEFITLSWLVAGVNKQFPAFLFTLPIIHVSFNEGLGEARGILLMRARGVNEAGALITIRFFQSQPGTHLAARRVSGRTL